MTLDDFLLVIYEMGYGQPMEAVSLAALEDSVGPGYQHLCENADAQGFLDDRPPQTEPRAMLV